MIPKVIHYCWFGRKEKPESVLSMIKKWHDVMPDYEIKEWNEKHELDDDYISLHEYKFVA